MATTGSSRVHQGTFPKKKRSKRACLHRLQNSLVALKGLTELDRVAIDTFSEISLPKGLTRYLLKLKLCKQNEIHFLKSKGAKYVKFTIS